MRFFLAAALALGLAAPDHALAQSGVDVSFQVFYDNLQPYGRWINNPAYGYVWAPNVEAGFTPYGTRGHWAATDYGNTWVSDYEWGWAPFHYGRWFYDDFYGWVWIPGEEWAPAWVSWRQGGGYYGWAPLGPGMSMDISVGLASLRWVFLPQRYICDPRPWNYYDRSPQVIYRNTTIINNVYVYNNRRYYGGPRPGEIERYTKSRVNVYHINNYNRPGERISNNTINIYRPSINRGQNARPSRVTDYNSYKNEHPDRAVSNRNNNSRPGQRPANSIRDRDNIPSRPVRNGQADQPGNNPSRQRPGRSDATVQQDNTNAAQQQQAAQRNEQVRQQRTQERNLATQRRRAEDRAGQRSEQYQRAREQREQNRQLQQNAQRGQTDEQQRQQRAQQEQQQRQQRTQQEQQQREQQRQQMQQQREQQRQQRSQQEQQQRQQRTQQEQQQREQQRQQMQQQREQQRQQRSQQEQQQRAQRQQQIQQRPQNGRPSRGGH